MTRLEKQVSEANKQYAWKMFLGEVSKLNETKSERQNTMHQRENSLGIKGVTNYVDNWIS